GVRQGVASAAWLARRMGGEGGRAPGVGGQSCTRARHGGRGAGRPRLPLARRGPRGCGRRAGALGARTPQRGATMSEEHVTVYTDGSCDTVSGRGGWAFLIERDGLHTKASGFESGTTNNRMELTAAVKALEALVQPSKVRIVTDSEYLKKAFTDGWLDRWQSNGWRTASRQPVKNQDLWQRLLELTT